MQCIALLPQSEALLDALPDISSHTIALVVRPQAEVAGAYHAKLQVEFALRIGKGEKVTAGLSLEHWDERCGAAAYEYNGRRNWEEDERAVCDG